MMRVMGILNVTPDSFSDGGKFFNKKKALRAARRMIEEGAGIIDVGGESSGPGSSEVALDEELRRVIPVVKAIARFNQPPCISVDTWKAKVAQEAIAAGAKMINDVTALRGDPEMAGVIARTGVKVVLMYSKDDTPRTTRIKKRYKDVMKTIGDFLRGRIAYAQSAGIRKKQIILDPGMGAFVSGDPKYSFEILRRLGELRKFGLPILVGTSRKSFLGGAVSERLVPTIFSNFVAVQNGASIIRVHDVAPHASLLL